MALLALHALAPDDVAGLAAGVAARVRPDLVPDLAAALAEAKQNGRANAKPVLAVFARARETLSERKY